MCIESVKLLDEKLTIMFYLHLVSANYFNNFDNVFNFYKNTKLISTCLFQVVPEPVFKWKDVNGYNTLVCMKGNQCSLWIMLYVRKNIHQTPHIL